jgi:hypothetical protein
VYSSLITTYYLYNKKPPLLVYIFFYIVDQIAAEKVVVKVVPIYVYDDTTQAPDCVINLDIPQRGHCVLMSNRKM